MHKMKSILHGSSRRRAQSEAEEGSQYHQAGNSQVEQNAAQPGEHSHSPSSGSHEDSMHTGRSRPLTSVYDSGRESSTSASQSAATDYAQPNPSDSNGSIANEYRAYLPILSSANDSRNEQNITLGGDRRLMAGETHGKHGEDVADRNINRYSTSLDAGQGKALPKLPNAADNEQGRLRHQNNRRKQSIGTAPLDSTIRAVPSDDSASQWQRSGDVSSSTVQDMPIRQRGQHTDARTGATDGPLDGDSQRSWKTQQKELLHNVVDLRDTVDTDRHVQVAPAVTHEIIKPHEHEVIQHKVYREIHHYSYYHRLQPVIHTEVLPPRHFIPNPRGEGLIEISADELPTRTGENRWWDIVQRPLPQPETQHQFRTEPEVVEGKPYITDEGFERKETTILYPPTLEDMEGYGGPIQPVHFDHKTGERWLGEMTTMDKLREELNHVSDADTMKFNELRESLPEVQASPTIKRKPVDW